MTTKFIFDSRQLDKLPKFYREARKQHTRAAGHLLNEFAFGSRSEIYRIIEANMTVRDPRFMKRQVRVEKSKTSGRLDSLMSLVGSIRSARFSGWEEQELGKRTKRHRLFTTLGRKGSSKSGKAKPGARLKNLKKFPQPNDYPGQNTEHRVIVMLRMLQRQKYRRPFMIHGHRKITAGLYKFSGRAKKGKPRPIKILHVFKPDKVQPRRLRWMSIAIRKYFGRINISREWEKQFSRAFKEIRTFKARGL